MKQVSISSLDAMSRRMRDVVDSSVINLNEHTGDEAGSESVYDDPRVPPMVALDALDRAMPGAAAHLVLSLASMFLASPPAFSDALRVASPGRTLCRTATEEAARRRVSVQAVSQARHVRVRAIKDAFPEIRNALEAYASRRK